MPQTPQTDRKNKRYNKVFVLDTNILLTNAHEMISLSQDSKNLIVLPETVIDEIDSKKSGVGEINFQAREVGRILSEAEIIDISRTENETIMSIKARNIDIDIISLNHYWLEDVDRSILNDRKIIKVAEVSKLHYEDEVVLLSNDIMCRTRAISLDVNTEAVNHNRDIKDLCFSKEFCIEGFNGNVEKIPSMPNEVSSVVVHNELGRMFFFYRGKNGAFKEMDESNNKRFPAPPLNALQKTAANLIMDETEISVIIGNAGSGKNVTALSAAMRLIDTTNYRKIYYMRRTIISGDNEDELGHLPGSLEEKMQGYMEPMESSIRKIATLKKRDAAPEEIDNLVEELRSKYNIEYLYAGHLRGSTLDENSIVILDEFQNSSINNLKTAISRVGKNSIVIVLGSNNQIDSKYLNKHNNALTALINKSIEESDISLRVVELKNVIRSKHAEWVDNEF